MYFEAEILIDPSDIASLEVPPRSRLRRLLTALTGGWQEVSNDQELLVGAVLLQCLQEGLLAAGIDDIVRLGRDGELLYHDQRGRAGDLDAAVAQAQAPSGTGFEQLRMVMQHSDEALHLIVDLHVSRVYPADGIPIRGYVHGFMRELDLRRMALGRGGDAKALLTDALRTRLMQSPVLDGHRSVPAGFKAAAARIADALQQALPGARVSHHARALMMMPRQVYGDPAQLTVREEPDAMAPFLCDPGFREIAFYAYQWGSLCHAHELRLRHILLVDEAGRPIVGVGDEPLMARKMPALVPGQRFESMPSHDVVFFTGHDRDAEVRGAQLVPLDAERSGLDARLLLREHEQRTLSGYVPVATPRSRATAGSTLGAEVRAAGSWKIDFGQEHY